MKNYKPVFIEWLDSSRGSGWVRTEEVQTEIAACKSIGWLIHEGKDSVTIAGHLGENPEQCCGDMTIPRKAIVRIRSIKIAK